MVLNVLSLTKFIWNFISNLVLRYPVPKNLGYMWNYGSLSGIFLVIQLLTGIFLAMFYTPHVDYAFTSVDHIMHNVMYGWIIRLVHLNSASFFFLFVYIHMLRGLYYQSYKFPKTNTWITGVTIYLLLMGTAFLGYVLPWGQMSYWAATVITNLLTVAPLIGHELVHWIWGGFSINNATLNRFFCLHYLLPFIICVFLFLHLIMLHKSGSNNDTKLKISINYNVKFYPFFIVKDLFTICLYLIFFSVMVFLYPELLNHSINYIESNPLVTPVHIVPEWYFLPFYAILRSILQKETGIIYMFFSIIILYLLPKIDLKSNRIIVHNSLYKKSFWIFTLNFIFLGYLGAQPIVAPIIELSLLCTWYHLYYFLFLLPIILKVETFELKNLINHDLLINKYDNIEKHCTVVFEKFDIPLEIIEITKENPFSTKNSIRLKVIESFPKITIFNRLRHFYRYKVRLFNDSKFKNSNIFSLFVFLFFLPFSIFIFLSYWFIIIIYNLYMFIFSLLPSVLINDLYSIRNILKIPTSLLLLIEYFFSYILIISMSIFNLILLFFCFLFRVLIIPYFFLNGFHNPIYFSKYLKKLFLKFLFISFIIIFFHIINISIIYKYIIFFFIFNISIFLDYKKIDTKVKITSLFSIILYLIDMIKYKYCKLLCSLEVLIIDLDKMRVDANLTYFVYYYFNKFKKLFYSENENDKLSKSIMDDYINELKKKGTPKNRHNGNQKRYYGNKVGGGVMHTSIKANVAT